MQKKLAVMANKEKVWKRNANVKRGRGEWIAIIKVILILIIPWKVTLLLWLAFKMVAMDSAALTGTVLFSIMILLHLATLAMFLAADSIYFRSGARPFPKPYIFVGVLTEMKIRSASSMAWSIFVEKRKFFPRTWKCTHKFSSGAFFKNVLVSLQKGILVLAEFYERKFWYNNFTNLVRCTHRLQTCCRDALDFE